MRQTRKRAIVATLPKRIHRGEEIAPSPTAVRRAKRIYVAARAGKSFGTNKREARREARATA